MAKKEKKINDTAKRAEKTAPKKVSTLPDGKKLSRKERKKQKKALLKQQLEYEKELVADGKIPARNKYHAKSFFGRAVALCLTFLFGIIATVGAFLGFGSFAPTEQVFWLLGYDYSNFLTEDYGKKSIVDLVGGILGDINSGSLDSLGAISKYTPVIDTYLGELDQSLKDLGVHVELETLKATKFDQLGTYFQDEVLSGIVLGEVMGVKPDSDAMLLGLCYGEEGVDYTVQGDKFVQVDGGRAPTKIGDLMDNPTDLLGTMRLGTLMGLSKNVTESALDENAMMYALCYGTRGVDYEVEEGKIVVLSDKKPKENKGTGETLAEEEPGPQYVHTFPTTLDALMNHSNAVIESLELGSMLGLDGSDIDTNGVMYSLAYGAQGVDWEYTGNKIEMLPGHDAKYPTKMGEFINNSNSLIDGMEIEMLMNIKPDSNSLMHYLAYGTEMPKGEAIEGDTPWREEGGKYYDKNDQLVDKYGYLLDAETNFYKTEKVKDEQGQEKDELQYVDGGKFVYEYGTDGAVTGIKMLPDPNEARSDPDDPWSAKLYAKKKVSDLTDGDADLVEGMKIGDAMEIDSSSSALMQAMKDWTIGDLKDQNKIESLTIGDIMAIDDESSSLMQALQDKTLADLKDQETINALTISDVLEIGDESSGILKAMQDWRLDDLGNQYRIERLKIGNVVTVGDGSSSLMQAMKEWRIGDLTKQEKIDSLTLGDVMVISDAEGILAALKDCPIGSMQTRIDTLTLTEILGKDAVEDNKLLKHLADSTVDTLASDMEALSIGEVFADELFSFMEIKGDKTYQALYEDYYKEHSNAERTSNLPQKYSPNGKPIVASEVETYYVLTSGETEVVLGYYTKSGEQFTAVPEGAVVKKDAAIAMANRAKDAEQKTPYYFETEIELTPVYTYYVVNYDQSKLDALPAGDEVRAEGETLYYKTGGAQYEIQEDGYSLYYVIPAGGEGEDTRVDLEREISGYKIEGGETMTLDKGKIEYNGTQYEVHHMKAVSDGNSVTKPAYDYITVRTEVYERFAEKGAAETHAREETTEKYRYTPAEGEAVQLDRYLEGVWFMLLAHEEEPSEGVGTITYDVSTPILDMDRLVTEINSSITSIPLWKLYFHGMLQEDPFVDLSTVFPEGFNLGDGRGTVKNLNECTVTDTIKLLQATIQKIPSM